MTSWTPPPELGLTDSEARMLSVLVEREGGLTPHGLYVALYGHKFYQPEPKIIDVFLCHLRRKLRPHGMAIETVGHGAEGLRRLLPDARARLREWGHAKAEAEP